MIRRFAADSITLLALVCAALLGGWLGYRAPRAADLPMATPAAVLPVRSFQDLEWLPDGRRFRWTNGQSRLSLPNPGGTARLRMRLIDGPAGNTPLAIEAPGATYNLRLMAGMRRYELLLPPSDGERIELVFGSPTVTIAGRAIGVGVADQRVAGGGLVPASALPPLALAAAAVYLLLRRARLAIPASAALVLALSGGLALWLHMGGWQYALLERALVPLAGAALAAAALDRWQERRATGGLRHAAGGRAPQALPAPRPAAGRSELAAGLALVLVAALALRLPWLLAADPTGDLELAARRMFYLASEGLPGAFRRGGDYMPLRLYYLWAASQLVSAAGASFAEPIAPLTMLLIKLPQLLADLATAALILSYARRWLGPRAALALALMYTCAPPVWINSGWWGQVDAWLMLPMLGALLLLDRGEGRWSWVCLALALLIKTQAIIFAPVLYIATLRRSGAAGLLRGAAAAGAVLLAGCAPLVAANQGFGLAEAYLGAVGRFPRTTYGAYNLWFLVLGGESVNDVDAALGPLSYRQLGVALLGLAVLLICIALWRRSTTVGRVEAAAALALAFFVLPTQMHARYLFLPLASLALAACADRRLVALFVALAFTATVNVLGILSGFWPAATALINASPLPLACAVVNCAALLVMLRRLLLRHQEPRTIEPRTPAPLTSAR